MTEQKPKYASLYCRGHIPWGYKRDPDNPKQLLAIDEQIDLLMDAYNYLDKGFTYRAVAEWLTAKSGRYISHMGIVKTWKNYKRLHDKRRPRTKEEQKECAAQAVRRIINTGRVKIVEQAEAS